MERIILNGKSYAVHPDVAAALNQLTDFTRAVANNTKDSIWQPEWLTIRDRALSLIQGLFKR